MEELKAKPSDARKIDDCTSDNYDRWIRPVIFCIW